MKVKFTPIFALVGLLAILSGMPALSTGITNYAYAKYGTNTQTQANANECDTGSNCAITSPQTQGDGTANSPTNLQISKFNEEQGEPNSPSDPSIARLDFNVEVECPIGMEVVCPDPEDFMHLVRAFFPAPSPPVSIVPDEFSGQAIIDFLFDGQQTTYLISIGPPDNPHGLWLRDPLSLTGDCIQEGDFLLSGHLSDGDHKSCNVTYHYDYAAYVLVIKETICPTGFSCPSSRDNTMMVEASVGELVSVNPQTFSGSDSGTLVVIAFTGDIIPYQVTETPPPPPSGLVLVQSPSEDCRGDIDRIGEVLTCTFTNEYRVAPTL